MNEYTCIAWLLMSKLFKILTIPKQSQFMFCYSFKKENIIALCKTITEVTSKICPPLDTEAVNVQENEV